MISSFPDFTKLELQHKVAVEAITGGFEPYSDFNFTSMFCWDVDDSTSVAELNGNLVVRMPDYLTGEPTFSILGDDKMDESLDALFEWAGHLSFVPEVSINAIRDPAKYAIEEDRDHHDYVYEVAELAALAGGKYKKIRNKLNSFTTADIEGIEVRTVHHIDPDERQKLLGLFDTWAEHSRQNTEDLDAEKTAFGKLLVHSETLHVLFTVVTADGQHIGLSVNELLDDNYSICHFEKAISIAHHNTFSFLTNETAKALAEHGSSYVNWEQDLGLEGTRKSKTSYRPIRFLKKYSVKLQ